MDIQNIIVDITEIIEETEKIKGYWDDTGLDMHIAVKKNKMIAVSTKHWFRVNYIDTKLDPKEIWKRLRKVSTSVGRKLIKSQKGDYVYIHKLNDAQTKDIFDKIGNMVGCSDADVTRVWEMSWEIKDAVLPKN